MNVSTFLDSGEFDLIFAICRLLLYFGDWQRKFVMYDKMAEFGVRWQLNQINFSTGCMSIELPRKDRWTGTRPFLEHRRLWLLAETYIIMKHIYYWNVGLKNDSLVKSTN